MGFETIRIRRRHVNGLAADLLLFTPESGFKSIRIRCRIRGMHVDRSRIWKEKVADSNYADSCGRGLRDELVTNTSLRARWLGSRGITGRLRTIEAFSGIFRSFQVNQSQCSS